MTTMTETFSFVANKTQGRLLRKAAKLEGVTMSAFMRKASIDLAMKSNAKNEKTGNSAKAKAGRIPRKATAKKR